APSSKTFRNQLASSIHIRSACCSIKLLFNDLNTLRFRSVRIGKLCEPDPEVNHFMTGQSKKISAALCHLRPHSAEKEVLDKTHRHVNCFLNYLLYICNIGSENGLITGVDVFLISP
ncbi:hypothetical protein, partial [Maridesulfovibrio zosterae]|uniref:hypothetical protein n=1 Tax=Maridesulfovibrio zosterae TaxID=82171 RepID=UPI0004886DBB